MAKRTLAQDINKTGPFSSAEQEAYLNIVRTEDVLSSDFAAMFRAHGLSAPLYNALRIVCAAGSDGVPSQKIAEDMVKRHPDVTRLVDRLERRRLVARKRSTEDRRVVRIVATAAGRRKVAGMDAGVSELHLAQLGHMSGERLGLLNELLVEARCGVGGRDAGGGGG